MTLNFLKCWEPSKKISTKWNSLPSALLFHVTNISASIDSTIAPLELKKQVKGVVSSLTGKGISGHADGSMNEARFSKPFGITMGSDGNLYVADTDNHRIKKITKHGNVTTIAGTGVQGSTDGAASEASFNSPVGIALGAEGDLYVTDHNNHKIRKISNEGIVSTIAGNGSAGFSDGVGTQSIFNYPWGIALDAEKNIFVAELRNHRIRKITPEGIVSTVAGDGLLGSADGNGSLAKFNHPRGIALDSEGNIFVADSYSHKIRKVTQNGNVSTFAGCFPGYVDGVGTEAKFQSLAHIVLDAAGNLFVADMDNHRIRMVSVNGEVSTVAGSSVGYMDGVGTLAKFFYPRGMTIDGDGNLIVADSGNHTIRKIM